MQNMSKCLFKEHEKGTRFCIFFESYNLQLQARSAIPCDKILLVKKLEAHIHEISALIILTESKSS